MLYKYNGVVVTYLMKLLNRLRPSQDKKAHCKCEGEVPPRMQFAQETG